jgi:predicted RNA binding protein YcfA (HicA-like mRNA interferase family)
LARSEKLVEAFKGCTGPFPWSDFVRLITLLGYESVKTGRTAGSRRRFRHRETGRLIICHEPHDGEMGPRFVREMQEKLRDFL